MSVGKGRWMGVSGERYVDGCLWGKVSGRVSVGKGRWTGVSGER